MTRSEAKKNLYYGIRFDTLKINEFIDKIYDEFENKKLEEFTFTNCNDCKHKIDGYFQEECISCKRYYACHFEKKQ